MTIELRSQKAGAVTARSRSLQRMVRRCGHSGLSVVVGLSEKTVRVSSEQLAERAALLNGRRPLGGVGCLDESPLGAGHCADCDGSRDARVERRVNRDGWQRERDNAAKQRVNDGDKPIER